MSRSAPASRLLSLAVVIALSAAFALVATADAVRSQEQEPDAAVLEQGQAVYEDQCQSCHGAEGKGDGPAARFLSPAPRDLSTGEFEYAEDATVEGLSAVIKGGIDDTPMTPFEGQLDDDQIAAVATYVLHTLVTDGGDRR